MMTPTHSATERDPQTHAIIGAAMEVHNELGPGFVEPVYRRPLEIELAARKIICQCEVPFAISYKGTPTGRVYRVDFVCFSEVVVEIKAVKDIGKLEQMQVLNYLKASKLRRALLLNFGARQSPVSQIRLVRDVL